MTFERLQEIESLLKERGYRNGGHCYHCNADYYWYKPFGKEDNPYEPNRALWQVFLNVYDWRKYRNTDPYCGQEEHAVSITVTIDVSRTIDEVAKRLEFDLKDGRDIDLNSIEDKAYCFWRYIEESFGAPQMRED